MRLHRVHPQPQKVTVDGKPMHLQFGVYTFIYRHSAEVPVQAQKTSGLRLGPKIGSILGWKMSLVFVGSC